ncbi:MAG: hypothetical protein ABH871_05610 [Pseudomonadota bacterium]
MKPARTLIFLLIIACISTNAFAKPVKRNLLAVVDGSEVNKEEYDKFFIEYTEMPLNHLGFTLDYVDVTKQLPDDKEMEKYAGIISWFTDNKLKGAQNYVQWLIRQLEHGKKLVVIDDFGFSFDENGKETPEDLLARFYKAFSISYSTDQTTDSPLLLEIIKNDPEMTEFERSLKDALTSFVILSPTDGNAKIFLKLKRKDTGSTCDAVFIHSKGGVVFSNYALYVNPANFQVRWRINPFKYFAQAFDATFPRPDVSTINGMRLFMSHIDGDGITNESYDDNKSIAGELTYTKILTHYNLPCTASVLIGDIPTVSGEMKDRVVNIIKKIFALPNVEPASHGWAHPYIWRSKDRKFAYKLKGYTYSPQNEIGNSIKYINEHLVPKGKETDIFFWTGDCRPDFEALKYVYDNNIMNLNGGDSRFDQIQNSYAYVAPFFYHEGGLLQNFAADANEVIFTNDWTGPFYGMKFAVETYKNTESPIRIRPIDIYYHYYIMERNMGIDSIKELYDWALTQEIAPVFASDYIKHLDGFLSTIIDRISPQQWVISNNGELRTIRLDDYTGYVDLQKSKGVLGYVSYQGSLYVHLDNGLRSEIHLTNERASQPYLIKANGKINNWWMAAKGVRFTLRTMGRVQFVLGGMKKNQSYTVSLKEKKFEVKSNERGELALSQDILKNRFEDVRILVNEG